MRRMRRCCNSTLVHVGHRMRETAGHAVNYKVAIEKMRSLEHEVRVFPVPEIGLKEERRVLRYASDGLKAKIGRRGRPIGGR